MFSLFLRKKKGATSLLAIKKKTMYAYPQLGCAGFASKILSLQSETKLNEIRFACVSHTHAKFFFIYSASFHFEFIAFNQSEINTPYFCFVSLPKIFHFASFRFWFFCFASKRNEINVFSLCFASKRNEINIFFASFHFTRYRLAKLKDRP